MDHFYRWFFVLIKVHQGLFTLPRRVALLAKIGPDKAEAEGIGGCKVEADNAVWPDFRRSPKGWGHFSLSLRPSSLVVCLMQMVIYPF
jgi:hypothetical protein